MSRRLANQDLQTALDERVRTDWSELRRLARRFTQRPWQDLRAIDPEQFVEGGDEIRQLLRRITGVLELAVAEADEGGAS